MRQVLDGRLLGRPRAHEAGAATDKGIKRPPLHLEIFACVIGQVYEDAIGLRWQQQFSTTDARDLIRELARHRIGMGRMLQPDVIPDHR